MNAEEVVDMESRIIEAAKRVFVRKGYEAASMSDIAREAEIGRTALHYYFRTKERLFEAIFGQLMGTLLPNIERIMQMQTSMLEKIPLIIEQYLSIVRANPSFPLFIVNELNRDPENVYRTVMKNPERIQPILGLKQQIEREMEEGILRKMPVLDIVSSVVSLVVFPMLVKDPLTSIFLQGDAGQFDQFVENRKELIVEIIIRLVTPVISDVKS